MELDGRIHKGKSQVWNYPTHRELRVYFHGASLAENITVNSKTQEISLRLFQKLVRANYLTHDQLDATLTPAIRRAAYFFANDLKDETLDDPDKKPWQALIHSFGEQRIGSLEYRRVAWLCMNVLKCVIPAWKAECDEDIGLLG